MFGLNPYILIGALVGALALFGAGFGYGHHVASLECDREKLAAVQAAITAYKAEAAQAATASTDLETKKEAIRVRTQTITKTVDRIVERPVYRDVCLDPDGVLAANAALGAPAVAGKPDGAVPRPDAAGGRNGRGGAAQAGGNR